MSPLSWSSSSSHQRGRGGRGNSSHHNRSYHGDQGERGSSSHHDGRGGRSSVTEITTQDQLNEVTRIKANPRYQMYAFIGKLGRELEEENDEELSSSQT